MTASSCDVPNELALHDETPSSYLRQESCLECYPKEIDHGVMGTEWVRNEFRIGAPEFCP
jgi:hypothetical protein